MTQILWEGDCIVTKPSTLPFFKSFLSSSKKSKLRVNNEVFIIDGQVINLSTIKKITVPSSTPIVITKSNYGIHIELENTWIFFFARGLKHYPNKRKTTDLINVIRKIYNVDLAEF